METSLKIQMDVKNNAQDLQNYMLDLRNWEEEMKKKELALIKEKPPVADIPPPRNKIKKPKQESDQNHSKKAKKISGYDYSAWDKFDADKACAEIDEEDSDKTESEKKLSQAESEEEDEKEEEKENDDNSSRKKKLSLVDEAFYEKELGNQFVKKEQWNDAIKCYTNAINLDSKNAIYYANRSLCFLKMKNFKSAEVDATAAVQLDNKYVKAYQRRAIARLALEQLKEAKSDYEKVLEIEPKNALARVEINKIDNKLNKESRFSMTVQNKTTFNPKEIFKNEEKKVTVKKNVETTNVKSLSSKPPEVKKDIMMKESTAKQITAKEETKIRRVDGDGVAFKKEILCKKEPSVFKPLPEWCKIVHLINVPPHKRSKKPLRRIPVVEVDDDEDSFAFQEPTGSLQVCMKKDENEIINKLAEFSVMQTRKMNLDIPKTSIQFQNCWKIVKNHAEEAYSYLQKIPWNKLPDIFENSLESDFFSELITFLGSDDMEKNPDFVYHFLLGLSNVKRFSSIILFLSESDRRCIKKCFKKFESTKSEEEISNLLRLYEL